ncbi:MAG: replicative DNA helicase [Planctomycetes bacterium]|nr:replicative DNA helicase [Planctomycetota bacterium]
MTNASPPVSLADQVPPQNVEAEVSLLGSILLDNRAMDEVVQIIDPESFYRPAHRDIFDVILALHDQRKPIDIVILRDELQRRGALERVGGLEYLATLTEAVPSAANAEYYAKIVKEKATLRGLIGVCHTILKEATEARGETGDLLDRAERSIFEIVKKKSKAEPQQIGAILKEAFHQLTDIHDRKERLTGVSTGFFELDDMICGLQPSQLVIVAGRPSMGKTSFVLRIAEHVGLKEQKGVLLFSMEMDARTIASNMLCSHAHISSHDLRRGRLGEADFQRLLIAAGQFTEAPIFIDDSSGLSVLDLRARARRMQSEHGIQLVLVDYLQLMESRGAESRQQEVSIISRSLKALARELSAPVIALSQLSRAVETREDRKPRMADLRECVPGDTRVVLADGRRLPIRDLVGAAPEVVAVDAAGKLVRAHADQVWRVGERALCRLQLASGRVLRATGDHRFLGAGGWTKAKELQPGDRLALARRLPEPARPESWPADRLILLAHLIGDGSYLVHQPLRYTTGSEENSRAVARAARKEFGVKVTRHPGRGNWHQLVFSGNGNRWHPAGMNLWLRELQVFGQRSFEKCIPEEIFRLESKQVSLLLRHLWATDGSISVRPPGRRGAPRVYYSTNSRTLAEDVAALLLRLGIVARLRTVNQGAYRPAITVEVSGAEAQRRFLDQVGAFGPRVGPGEALRAALEDTLPNPNVDTLPNEWFADVRGAMKERGLSQRAMAALRGTSYGGASHFRFAPSRATLAEYGTLLENPELKQRAESDLFWDRVVAIEAAGREEVFDLTVPGPACWLADGIVTHNSGAIEQDADVIMMLYREEYYNPNTKPGIAEVIIAKQRNGPIGSIDLAFVNQFARFENLSSMSPGTSP